MAKPYDIDVTTLTHLYPNLDHLNFEAEFEYDYYDGVLSGMYRLDGKTRYWISTQWFCCDYSEKTIFNRICKSAYAIKNSKYGLKECDGYVYGVYTIDSSTNKAADEYMQCLADYIGLEIDGEEQEPRIRRDYEYFRTLEPVIELARINESFQLIDLNNMIGWLSCAYRI